MYSFTIPMDRYIILFYNYYEQVVVRDWETGEEIERFNGQMHRMPNGDIWEM